MKYGPRANRSGSKGHGVRIGRRSAFSKKAYDGALEKFKETFSDREYFFENLMVAATLYLTFPSLDSKEALWKSYVSLCNLYSFYRFVSVLGCGDEAAKAPRWIMGRKEKAASRHTMTCGFFVRCVLYQAVADSEAPPNISFLILSNFSMTAL